MVRINPVARLLGIGFACVWSLLGLYLALYGELPPYEQLATHIGFGLTVAFLLGPIRYRNPEPHAGTTESFPRCLALRLVPAAAAVAVWTHATLSLSVIEPGRFAEPHLIDIVFAATALLLTVWATARLLGAPLAVLVTIGLAYLFFGDGLPGFWGHRGFTVERNLSSMYMRLEGILGVATATSANIIFPIILFGAFLSVYGVNNVIENVAMALFSKGHAATSKVCIASSAMFGMITGSGPGNAAQTGVYTIPLMRSAGYKRRDAAAVEAVASVGGDLVPPVMGATAFVMATFLQVPYSSIIQVALIPAFLWYFTYVVSTHLVARRDNIDPPRKNIDTLKILRETARTGWVFVLPLGILIYGLAGIQVSPPRAAAWSIVVLLLLDGLRRAISLARNGPGTFSANAARMIYDALVLGARMGAFIAVATSAIDIFIRVVGLTGAGIKFTQILTGADQGLFFTLILAALGALILGTGLPGLAVYLITVLLLSPALVGWGVLPIVAHFFVYYYGNLAGITPPTAVAPYVTAGIAGSRPTETQMACVRLSGYNFLIPFLLVYRPGLLQQSDTLGIVVDVAAVSLGAVLYAIAVTGYFRFRLRPWARILSAATMLVVVFPHGPAMGGRTFTLTVVSLVAAALIILMFATRGDRSERFDHSLMSSRR